ncbi:MAG: M48 family metalloprotease [Cyanobacteria bacterium P01_E01_bin.42]
MSLPEGLEALKQKRYTDAIAYLDSFLATSPSEDSREYYQAQTALVRAYYSNQQYDKAIALCRKLLDSSNPTLGIWAQQSLDSLQKKSNSGKSLLQTAKAAHKEKRYPEAIEALQTFLKTYAGSPQCGQVQIMLVKAYKANKQIDEAIALCVELLKHEDPLVQNWAQQGIGPLRAIKAKQEGGTPPRSASNSPLRQAGRAATTGVRLAMAGTKDSLALVSTITLMMLGGMLFTLFLALTFIVDSANPTAGLGISILLTIGANLLIFFLSPFLLDLTQRWLYGTRWVSLADIERHSPESARVIQRVCQQKKLKQPRLGIINDETPTAFTYGSLPNTARIVVSQGLFTYLEDEEAATVYAHELGHVVHWDFAVMTIASTLVQITYLVYVWLKELDRGNDRKSEWAGKAAIVAYIFYIIGTYLQLYLSRIREYYADRFAAQTTGNPNALSRALVKIAYGVLEVSKKSDEPNRLTEGTRALGIYDPRAAASTGTAYRVAKDSRSIGRIFLWDLFNPWAFWMELNSTHPLTGKRVRALSTYAEQLGLDSEFDMVQVVRDGRLLDKKRLYGNFVGDLLRYLSPWLGFVLGGALFVSTGNLGFVFLFGGIGLLFQTFALFPRGKQWRDSDVFSLMCDPYASPFRPIPTTLKGEIIGRGDSGYAFGSDMMFQDDTGLMYLHYASLWGPLGNFFFGATQVQGLIGSKGRASGWFRRGISPYMDIKEMAIGGKIIGGHHDTWMLIMGGVSTLLGVILMFG